MYLWEKGQLLIYSTIELTTFIIFSMVVQNFIEGVQLSLGDANISWGDDVPPAPLLEQTMIVKLLCYPI